MTVTGQHHLVPRKLGAQVMTITGPVKTSPANVVRPLKPSGNGLAETLPHTATGNQMLDVCRSRPPAGDSIRPRRLPWDCSKLLHQRDRRHTNTGSGQKIRMPTMSPKRKQMLRARNTRSPRPLTQRRATGREMGAASGTAAYCSTGRG